MSVHIKLTSLQTMVNLNLSGSFYTSRHIRQQEATYELPKIMLRMFHLAWPVMEC